MPTKTIKATDSKKKTKITPEEFEEKYKDLISDKDYRTKLMDAMMVLNRIIMSDEFKTSMGVKKVEKENKKGQMDVIEESSPAYDKIFNGLDDLEASISLLDANRRFSAFQRSYKLFDALSSKDKNGKSCYDKLKDAAPSAGVKTEDLDRALSFFNKSFSIGTRNVLDIPSVEPVKAAPEFEINKEKSWKNYCKSHLQNIPSSASGQKEYLAKAMASAFRTYQEKNFPETKVPFSIKQARKDAETLLKDPVFNVYFRNPYKVKNLLRDAAERPTLLAKTTFELARPFMFTSKDDRMEILRTVKEMSLLMDPAKAGDAKWKALHEKINSIDLNDPQKCGEEKLQEIFNATANYMKGKKSLRSSSADQRMFDQALDIYTVFSKGSDFAKAAVKATYDRINEVRKGNDPAYRDINPKEFGYSKMIKHADVRNPGVRTFKERHFLPEESKFKLNVFEALPVEAGGDKSRLVPWDKTGNNTPLRLNSQFRKLDKFVANYERNEEGLIDTNKPKTLTHEEATEGLARALALSESQMFFLQKKDLKKYFYDPILRDIVDPEVKYNGRPAPINSSITVIDKQDFNSRFAKYKKDPVVKEMAKNYMAAGSRMDLTGNYNPLLKDNKTERKGNPHVSQNPAQKKVINEGADPGSLNIERIKTEYAATKKKLASKQAAL